MRQKLLRVTLPGILVVASIGLAACGSDSSSDSSSSTADAQKEFAAPTEAPSDAQAGGDLTVIAASDVDYIDPGAAYYQWTFMVTSATQSSLEAYAPADIEKPTPLLATEAHPRSATTARRSPTRSTAASSTRRRSNREVTAADVKYAIERSLLPGVPNGFVQTYLSGVEGHRQGRQGGPGQPDRRCSRHQRDHGTGRHDARDQADQHDLDRRHRRPDPPGQRPGPGGVREAVRRGEPVDVRRAPGRDRSVHDRERLPTDGCKL